MEKLIIQCLLEGMNQKEIAQYLSDRQIIPSSLSGIEKTIKKLNVQYGAKTMFHLGAKIATSKISRKIV